MSVTVVAGTDKGGFLIRSDNNRRDWRIEGPIFKGWKVTAVGRNGEGDYLAGTGSFVYGAAIQRSRDLKEWRQVERGPAYDKDSGRKLNQIWRIAGHHGVCYAGVDEAGLFRSRDGGETWEPLHGLNDHPTRRSWQPGNGGLCCHAILLDPKNPKRLWCGISAVGVFRSDDGGQTWHPKNKGVRVILEDKDHPDIGYCVHGLAQDPKNPDVIYRQDHVGMYRSRDGGDTWEVNENGLGSSFGFPIAIDKRTRTLFAIPLESDEYRLPREGKLRVFRSTDGGDSWQASAKGLPQEHAYAGVLRGALATDEQDPAGVYFGTTAGDVYVSNDLGESWRALPCRLPRIHCIAAFSD